MTAAADLLAHPLAAVDALFAENVAQCVASGRGPSPEWGEREHFARALGLLGDEESFARIPCLNDAPFAEQVPPFSLVRYRCLVQDIFEPEIYAMLFMERDAASAEANGGGRLVTTKYRECTEPGAGKRLEELGFPDGMGQRGACYCVPLPGETAWARAASARWGQPLPPGAAGAAATAAASGAATQQPKRRRPDEDVEMAAEELAEEAAAAAARPRTGAPATTAAAEDAGARPRGGGSNGTQRSAEEFGMNFPLPSEEKRGSGASTACIVKLYDKDAEALRLCEAVEVVGVLCVNPEVARFSGTPFAEAPFPDARQPSTALVPRLHALMVRHLPFHNPLLPYTPAWLTEERLSAAFQQSFANGALVAARDAAIAQLTQCLGGDALAAEYVLMLLVARSFGKHGDKLLGTFSLNLTRWPEGADARGLAEAAAELMPRAVRLEVTADSLGTQRWRPRKDFVANRLVASQLQLAAGTLLILDETKMVEGKVSAEGVKAHAAIQALIVDQLLTCDFESYDVRLPLELLCVLVSRQRSMIVKDVDVIMPLRSTATPSPVAGVGLESNALEAARLLIGLVTRSPRPLRIPDDVCNQIGEDFAAARQELGVRPELSNTWMCLVRAHCLTLGEDALSAERWQAVLGLERQRLLRCKEDGLLAA